MPTIRRVTPDQILSVTVRVEGNNLKDSVNLLSIEVEHGVYQIGHATIIIDDPKALIEFKRGAQIEIEFSYDNQRSDPIFIGVIINHDVSIEDGKPIAIIECYDRAIELDIDKNSMTFEDMSAGDVINHICNAHGLLNEISLEQSQETLSKVSQAVRTDWDFITALALSQNAVLINKNGKLTAQKPKKTRAVIGLSLGKDMLNFQGSLGNPDSSSKARPMGVVQGGGSAKANVGDAIRLKGVGEGFNGDAYISVITHTAHNGIWTSTYAFGLDLDHMGAETEQESLFPEESDYGVLHTLVSNNGHSIIVDEQQNIITITTADGNRLILDDFNQTVTLQDTHDNTILMNEDAITITSARNINIDAGESLIFSAGDEIIVNGSKDIALNADRNISLTANNDATVDAMNVTLDATASVVAKGSASAKLESSAQTTVRGSLVTIN